MKCNICTTESILKHQSVTGYKEPDTFSIHYCPNCNASFSLPRVETTEIYESIYREGYRIPGYDRYWKYSRTIKEQKDPLGYLADSEEAYWGVREAVLKYSENNKIEKILEVGSGLGYLTFALNSAGFNTKGIDISQTAVDDAVGNFGSNYICDDVTKYAISHQNEYDLIILTEVIEHIYDPVAFISPMIGMLKKGGQVILTTPNKSIFPGNIVWQTELPPVHVWWLSEDSMRVIAEKTGTTAGFVDYSKFYRKNFKTVNISKPVIEHKPVLNSKNEFITGNGYEIREKKNRKFLSQLPALELFLRKMKVLLTSDLRSCGERGIFMCVTLSRNEE